MNLFTKLIKNNTNYNSKTFIMLVGVGLTWLTTIAILPLIYISVLNGLVVPWYGISAFITSISTFAAVVIWGKVKTDSYYRDEMVSENELQNPQEG